MRRAAIDFNITLLTTLQVARLFVTAFAHYRDRDTLLLLAGEYIRSSDTGAERHRVPWRRPVGLHWGEQPQHGAALSRVRPDKEHPPW